MLGRAITQYWDTPEIPSYVEDLCETFRSRNPGLSHRLFSESEGERLIASHFGPREAAAFKACAVPAMQSDYFRYCAVLALGGVYADVDYVCVSSLQPLIDRPGGEIFLSPTPRALKGRDATRLWNGFFAFKEPGHPLLRLTVDIATANMEERISERVWPAGENVIQSVWLTAGPGIFSLLRFMRDWGSFDAFVETVRGTAAEPFASLYCEVVGEYQRVVEAFDDVRISSFDDMTKWVGDPPEMPLPYQKTDIHWQNARGSIFR